MNIIGMSGSLRAESYTTKLLRAFQKYAPEDVTFTIIDISKLPFINQDLEANLPEPVQALHAAIEKADGVIFATPEYNRSYSPVIKNAIDWGSRPHGNNAWDGMPAGIVGCSPFSLGGFGAVHHLRQVMVFVNTAIMQQPEFYLSFAGDKFDDNGELTDEKTKEKIAEFWTAFKVWTYKIGQMNS